jgi:hypothetical protein
MKRSLRKGLLALESTVGARPTVDSEVLQTQLDYGLQAVAVRDWRLEALLHSQR